MKATTEEILALLFERMMAKDIPGMLALFSDDACLFDPHYPVPTMEGKAEIERGIQWALGVIVKPGFSVTRVWSEKGVGIVEVATDHLFGGGQSIQFDQVFRFEIKDEKIVRLVAFTPHGPPGIGGWMAWLTGLWWKLKG